ncbi:hypothetical protein SLS55_000106 [Diplodia seriata]|uniref:Uncharacterized protein n=1 Tax=Diplodia seriata TaxID=420778 RepID=A0ABR3CVV3_9PEZI
MPRLALMRNLDSQTYSAFIEEAEILDSFTAMEPPVRYSRTAPCTRFYCAIVMGQLFLLSTVVALVLTIINYNRADEGDRVSYIVWLVFSAAATLFFVLLTFIFFHQRRKLCVMQCKLQRMQAEAEAHGSQKHLEVSSSGAPQLRAETDHRLSVLAQHQFEAAAESAAAADSARRRSSVIAANQTGRRRQMSSAAGEGCELSLFQTHLSNGSTKDGVADLTTSSAPIQTPPPTYLNPLQRHLERESTTTRLWQDDPTMMDLFHGLAGAQNNNNDNSNQSPPLAIRSRRSVKPDPPSPTPSPRRRTATIASHRGDSTTLQASSDPFTISSPATAAAANRSSTALPFPHPAASIDDSSSNMAFSRARAISTTSSSPDYGVLLPAFPLPPSHARFSDPSLAPPSPPPRLPPPPPPTREEMREEEKEIAKLPPLTRVSCAAAEQQQEQPQQQERTVWGRMAKVMGVRRSRAGSAVLNDGGEGGKNDGDEEEEEEKEEKAERERRNNSEGILGTDDGGRHRRDFLEPQRYDDDDDATMAIAVDGRRDSHVDPDQEDVDVDGEPAHDGAVVVVDEDANGKMHAARRRRRPTLLQAQSAPPLPLLLPTDDHRPSTWCSSAPRDEQHDHRRRSRRRRRSQPVTTAGLQHHHYNPRRSSSSLSSLSSLSFHMEPPACYRADDIGSDGERDDGAGVNRKQSVSSGAWRAASRRGRSASNGSRFVEEDMG